MGAALCLRAERARKSQTLRKKMLFRDSQDLTVYLEARRSGSINVQIPFISLCGMPICRQRAL
jgi:hypothetical protein